MDSREIYKVIGLMSGTSLDGLDLAYCVFKKQNDQWRFKIEAAVTVKYSKTWTEKLSKAHFLKGEDLVALDASYGKLLGEICLGFIKKNKLKVDFISSHGHTIYHQPKKGFTYQLGSGYALHAASALPVVNDFRSLDVALGGQGAPLVPAGDRILFSDYEVCLNIGGIANLSMDVKGKRTASDICFANMGLNYLAGKLNKAYDKDGAIAADGLINNKLLSKLDKVYNNLKTSRPSLGREIFEHQIKPLLDDEKISVPDSMRTFAESTAKEIVNAFPFTAANVLCTGGGAFNAFLISAMLDRCSDAVSLVVPDEEVVKFKEALIFAFLGVLKVRGEVNCLKNVTGASRDSSGGTMIGFF
jgi:anhydro-N-acetylmuramic acid kinase